MGRLYTAPTIAPIAIARHPSHIRCATLRTAPRHLSGQMPVFIDQLNSLPNCPSCLSCISSSIRWMAVVWGALFQPPHRSRPCWARLKRILRNRSKTIDRCTPHVPMMGVEALVPSAGSLTTGRHGTQAPPCAFCVPVNQNQTWFKIPQRHGLASAGSWRSMSAGALPPDSSAD